MIATARTTEGGTYIEFSFLFLLVVTNRLYVSVIEHLIKGSVRAELLVDTRVYFCQHLCHKKYLYEVEFIFLMNYILCIVVV